MSQQPQPKTLSKPQGAKRELREWLQGEQFKRELTALLPRTMSAERFVRIAFQATHRNPDLLKCSQESFFNCLLQLGAMGLEPDGRRAHLIPFGQECTLVVDYKGIKEVVRRNKDVSVMHGDVVGENDNFEVRYGTRGILDHVPNLQNRGRIYCAYSWVKLPDGNEEYDVMSLEEIESVRKRSRSPNKGPWVTDWNEMAKKTVFRRHAKGLPLSPDTRDALERDNDADALTEVERFKAAAPARATVLGGKATPRPTPIDTGDLADGSLAAQGRHREGMSDDREGMSDHRFGVEQAPNLGGQAQSPREPQSDERLPGSIAEPPGPSLAELVDARLSAEGYQPAELLGLMKGLKLAPKEAEVLDDISDQHLAMVLEQWENASGRLKEARQAQSQASQP